MQYDATIPPGGEGKITLDVRTKNFHGHIKKTAKVYSNDPHSPEVTVSIQGNLWVPIFVSNGRVRLKGTVGEDISNTIRIRGQKDLPLVLTSVSVNIPEKVEIQIHKEAEEQDYLVAFKNKLNTEGQYFGFATITTNYPDKPKIPIQILGAISANVHAQPSVLSFPFIPKKHLDALKQSQRSIEARAITVYMDEGTGLEVGNVSLQASLYTFSVNESEPGKRYQIDIKPIIEKLTVGMNEDLLKISTNQEYYESFEIPIRFNIGR